jgi:hypothetical protein
MGDNIKMQIGEINYWIVNWKELIQCGTQQLCDLVVSKRMLVFYKNSEIP